MKKKSVKRQVDDNLEVVEKKDGKLNTLKKGTHVDHSRKHLEENTIGMNLGTTVNMENYESLRVDVWATVGLEGKTLEQGYGELFGILDRKLKEAVEYYTE